MSQALSQVKLSIPLMEIVKLIDCRNETIKIINDVVKKDSKEQKDNEELPFIYLGTSVNEDSTKVNPFFLTLLIKNKLVKNCMLDFGAVVNIMPHGVMKEL